MRNLAVLALVALLAAPLAAAQSADTPALKVSPGENEISLAPGEERMVKAQITNPTDRTLEVRVTVSSAPRNDGYAFTVNPATATIRLLPLGNEIVHFKVTAPPREAAPHAADVIIRAQSSGVLPGEARIAARLTILDLVLDPPTVADPGEGKTPFRLFVRNPSPYAVQTTIRMRASQGFGVETPDSLSFTLEARSEKTLRFALRHADATIQDQATSVERNAVAFFAQSVHGAGDYGKAVLHISNATNESSDPPPATPSPEPVTPEPVAPTPQPPPNDPSTKDPDLVIRVEAVGIFPREARMGQNESVRVRISAERGDPGEIRVQAAIKAMPDVLFAAVPETFVLNENESREVEIRWRVPVTHESTAEILVDASTTLPLGATDAIRLQVFFAPALNDEPPTNPEIGNATLWEDPVGFAQANPIAAAGAAAGATLSVAGVALLARQEGLRYALLAPAVGLFTRLTRPKVLDHELRDKLLARIREKPGVTYGELKRTFDLNTGTLVHHLQMLEQHRFVASRREGHARRFYPVGERLPDPRPDALTPMQERILSLLDAGPLTQKQIAERLGLTKQGANHHVKSLERKGALAFELRNGTWFCVRSTPGPTAFVRVDQDGA